MLLPTGLPDSKKGEISPSISAGSEREPPLQLLLRRDGLVYRQFCGHSFQWPLRLRRKMGEVLLPYRTAPQSNAKLYASTDV